MGQSLSAKILLPSAAVVVVGTAITAVALSDVLAAVAVGVVGVAVMGAAMASVRSLSSRIVQINQCLASLASGSVGAASGLDVSGE